MADGRRVYRRERLCFRWSPFDCAQGKLYEFHFASLFEIHSTAFDFDFGGFPSTALRVNYTNIISLRDLIFTQPPFILL